VLASRSLEWMWTGLLYDDEKFTSQWTGHLDFVPQSKLDALPPDCQEMRQALDEYMASSDPSYMEDVYGHGRWIRRVAHFAIYGWGDGRDFTMAQWMFEEWAEVIQNSDDKTSLVYRQEYVRT